MRCSNSQIVVYQDICKCGTTGSGYSTGQGSGTGNFNIYIKPGSTIKKAYILSYRIGYPPPATFTLNGFPYSFDTADYFSEFNHISQWSSPIRVYYKDVTQDINASILSYTVSIPTQFGLPINWGYCTLYLYIIYENPLLAKSTCSIIVNNQKLIGNESYSVGNINPIDAGSPVGFAVYTDRVGPAFAYNQNSAVSINSTFIGKLSASDNNSSNFNGAGVKGSFYYQNNTLYGLQDDTSDSLVGGGDGLVDISSYLANNSTTFSFGLTDTLYPNLSPASVNTKLAFFLTYSTPCDTFTTTASTLQDTICLGDSVQLSATGGVQYSWYSPFSTFNDSTLANPIATPTQSTTYIVTIKNDSGCVKTEHVKIYVIQPPDSVTSTATICGKNSGSITVHTKPGAGYNFTLYNANQNPIANNATGVFTQLAEGTYIVESKRQMCTFYDTVAVGSNKTVFISYFYISPLLGNTPLQVSLSGSAENATAAFWQIAGENYNTQQMSYTFTQGGSYNVCFIAYNNQPHCADTKCARVEVTGETNLIIPNVFTPNGDGVNEGFVIQLTHAELLESMQIKLYNRWGALVCEVDYEGKHLQEASNLHVWNGITSSGLPCSEGTYYYTVSYTSTKGEKETLKGNVMLLR